MIQEIRCSVCRETVVGSIELSEVQEYKGDLFYGFVCQNHSNSIVELKQKRLNEIDFKTQEIISRGFVFDDQSFSLSDNAQRNWIGIAAGLASNLYTEENFPFPLSDLNNMQYDLMWENRWDFLDAVKTAIGSAKVSGTILKQAIIEAIDEEALNLIVDNR